MLEILKTKVQLHNFITIMSDDVKPIINEFNGEAYALTIHYQEGSRSGVLSIDIKFLYETYSILIKEDDRTTLTIRYYIHNRSTGYDKMLIVNDIKFFNAIYDCSIKAMDDLRLMKALSRNKVLI